MPMYATVESIQNGTGDLDTPSNVVDIGDDALSVVIINGDDGEVRHSSTELDDEHVL